MFILVPHELEYQIFAFAESVHNLCMRTILLRVDFCYKGFPYIIIIIIAALA